MHVALDIPDDALLSYMHPSMACAIGALATNWTLAETMSELLIIQLLDVEPDIGAVVTTPLGNLTRMQILESLIEQYEYHPKFTEHLSHAVKLFNRNRENRNTIMHAVASIGGGGSYVFEKRDLNRGVRTRIHETTIEQVWGVARNAYELMEYLSALDDCFIARRKKKRVPWPQITPLPDKLDLRPLDH